MLKFGNTYLNFNGTYLNGYTHSGVMLYSNTEYDVIRTPSENEALTINVVVPTADYNVFALKWQEHWGCNGGLYDMGIHTISNNYDLWECLCRPVPYSACPLWHKSGITSFPGNYSNCNFTAQGGSYNDSYLYKEQSNSSFYNRKIIYNNNNNTISGFLDNTFMFQITGLDTFTSFSSFTFGGNATFPATAYVKNINLYAFANASDAISW